MNPSSGRSINVYAYPPVITEYASPNKNYEILCIGYVELTGNAYTTGRSDLYIDGRTVGFPDGKAYGSEVIGVYGINYN